LSLSCRQLTLQLYTVVLVRKGVGDCIYNVD